MPHFCPPWEPSIEAKLPSPTERPLHDAPLLSSSSRSSPSDTDKPLSAHHVLALALSFFSSVTLFSYSHQACQLGWRGWGWHAHISTSTHTHTQSMEFLSYTLHVPIYVWSLYVCLHPWTWPWLRPDIPHIFILISAISEVNGADLFWLGSCCCSLRVTCSTAAVLAIDALVCTWMSW